VDVEHSVLDSLVAAVIQPLFLLGLHAALRVLLLFLFSLFLLHLTSRLHLSCEMLVCRGYVYKSCRGRRDVEFGLFQILDSEAEYLAIGGCSRRCLYKTHPATATTAKCC